MTEWNNPTELGEVTSTSKPCAWCPAHLWMVMHDPNNRDGEKQIRADQYRKDQHLLDVWMRRAKTAEAEVLSLRAELRRKAKAS